MASVAEAFQLALSHHQAGELEPAESIYREIVRIDPRHSDALHLMGVVAHQRQQSELAVDYISRAIAVNDSASVYHYNLGNAYRKLGRFGDAVASYEAALRIQPDFAEAHFALGNALKPLGRIADAVDSYQRAIQQRPDYVEPRFNLGNLYFDVGQLDKAIASYREAVRMRPDDAAVHGNLAAALAQQGEIDEAILCYRRSLEIKPLDPNTLNNLGNALKTRGDFDAAMTSYRRAVEVDPGFAAAHKNLGSVLGQLGRFDESAEHCRKAIDLEPENTKAYHLLSLSASLAPRREDESRLKGLAGRQDIPAEDRAVAYFCLGAICDRRGSFDQAFEYYQAGNQLGRQRYDHKSQVDYTNRVIATYSADFFADTRPGGSSSELPVFIVGMPRSGTTLLEQILSSHPRMHGAGELAEIRRLTAAVSKLAGTSLPYPQAVTQLDPGAAEQLAERYLGRLRKVSRDALRITDKMPSNFLHLGLIARLFPRARIIHCRRHPLDVCLSNYFQNFEHLGYSYDLEDVGRYYLEYERLMAHWQTVLPLDMLLVDYEELVEDQRGVSRRLIAFCGLDWDDRCLEFHRNGRPIGTASLWQVRQPIYSRSVGRWKHYDKYLGPLKKVLGWTTQIHATTTRNKPLSRRGFR